MFLLAIVISLSLNGCYSYGGLKVRRPHTSHIILGKGQEAAAAAANHDNYCYGEVFGMDIKFNKVFGNIYEGVEVQCGNNHWVKLNDDDILAYPIMRDYLLHIEDAQSCNDIYNKIQQQIVSIPTPQIYHQLEVMFNMMDSICNSNSILPPYYDPLCHIKLPYTDGEVILKYSNSNGGYMFDNGVCYNTPIDGNKFITYSRIAKKNTADIPTEYMGKAMTCAVIRNTINASMMGSMMILNSRQMEGICSKIRM